MRNKNASHLQNSLTFMMSAYKIAIDLHFFAFDLKYSLRRNYGKSISYKDERFDFRIYSGK